MKHWIFCCCLLAVALGGYAQPTTDITERSILKDRKPLQYQSIREADIFWERRIWRIVDTREKMNASFRYPDQPLFEILKTEALAGRIPLYDPSFESYGSAFDPEDLQQILYRQDTVRVWDVDTHTSTLQVVQSEINVEDIKRYRLEEIWYFDSRTSTMNVQIIGIAPMLDVTDENGNFLFERPLFWVNLPESRPVLDQYQVYIVENEAHRISWTDLFDMRLFSSYIYKGPDLQNRKLDDIYTGVDLLLQSQQLEAEIFNFEHDLWSW
jgi:gliding motility associated protien GldN